MVPAPKHGSTLDVVQLAGAELTRTTVRLLRQTFELLDETALAELDAELRAEGLDAIGATAVPEGLHPGDGPGVVFPCIGSKKRLLDLVVDRLPAGGGALRQAPSQIKGRASASVGRCMQAVLSTTTCPARPRT